MIKEITASGKDILEAKENARAALGVDELADVQFEVVYAGSRGIFGLIGVKPAQVRAYIELPDAPERRHGKPNKPQTQNGGERRERKPEQNTEKGAGASTGDAPKKSNRNKPRKPKTERIPDTFPDKPQEPKSVVIPETELKFEKKEVAEGEDMSFEFVKKLVADIGLSATVELFSCDDGTRRITIDGDDASVLIGHHGDTLDALQYLANLASAQKNINGERDKSRVTIDIEGYRAKREATLRALARRMAAKALRNRRSVMLEPMTPYERRIIHSEVQKIEGVSTNSVGADNNRKIVIYLTDKKPAEIFDDEPTETPLREEFAAEETDTVVSGAVEPTTPVDPDENEVIAVEKTAPAEDEDPVDADADK